MDLKKAGALRFDEGYFERIWGGNKLQSILHKPTPSDKVIGEAWTLSDHEAFVSTISEGPLAGQSLRDVMEACPEALLGALAKPTPDGRFPLLLKLLDSAQALSVQVHPDDVAALRLGEPDVGKTEMWYVLDADEGSELICGIDPECSAEQFAQAIPDGSVEKLMTRFPAPAGCATFVSAGTVHAIGGGLLIAEIQQNSNITYRIYDWNRVDETGQARELHVDKALAVTHFGSPHGGAAAPLAYEQDDARCKVLSACHYFAAERIALNGLCQRSTQERSFHILLGEEGLLEVQVAGKDYALEPGQTLLIPAVADAYRLQGKGACLLYYVPDLGEDILSPLRAAGHSHEAIVQLGGDPATSDLTPCFKLQ